MSARSHAAPVCDRPGIVGVGAGGHAKSIIDAIVSTGDRRIVGLVDRDRQLWGRCVLGYPVVGGDDGFPRLLAGGASAAFNGIGGTGDNRVRAAIFERLTGLGFELPVLVHRSAIVAPSARLGRGTVVLAGVIVGADAEIGENVIVNTGTIVEHECWIGDHAHLATGARLAGTVTVGAGAHVGIGAVIRQGIVIGERAIVGAGAVVVRDVEAGSTVVGAPARPLVSRA